MGLGTLGDLVPVQDQTSQCAQVAAVRVFQLVSSSKLFAKSETVRAHVSVNRCAKCEKNQNYWKYTN